VTVVTFVVISVVEYSKRMKKCAAGQIAEEKIVAFGQDERQFCRTLCGMASGNALHEVRIVC